MDIELWIDEVEIEHLSQKRGEDLKKHIEEGGEHRFWYPKNWSDTNQDLPRCYKISQEPASNDGSTVSHGQAGRTFLDIGSEVGDATREGWARNGSECCDVFGKPKEGTPCIKV